MSKSEGWNPKNVASFWLGVVAIVAIIGAIIAVFRTPANEVIAPFLTLGGTAIGGVAGFTVAQRQKLPAAAAPAVIPVTSGGIAALPVNQLTYDQAKAMYGEPTKTDRSAEPKVVAQWYTADKKNYAELVFVNGILSEPPTWH